MEALRQRGLHRSMPIEVISMDTAAELGGSVAGVLQSHEMPLDDIRAVLTTDDPELVHRYLELHRERLEEWLTDQRRILAELERRLAKRATERRRGRDGDVPHRLVPSDG